MAKKQKGVNLQEYFEGIEIVRKVKVHTESYSGYKVHKGDGHGSDGSVWAISWMTGRATSGDEDICFEDILKYGSEADDYR